MLWDAGRRRAVRSAVHRLKYDEQARSVMGKYSIWVLDYAAVNKFPQSVMLYGPQYAGIRNLPYAYVLIKGQGHAILVDTGYDHKEYGKHLADLYCVSNWHPAS